MTKTQKALIFAALTLALSAVAKASDFQYNGKTVTKGEAIKILIQKPDAKVLKIDQVMFDQVKGTIRNVPK
jgi:hypothetical protein